MSVRRGAMRLAAVLTVLGFVLVGAAAPAAADEDRVKIKVPGRFSAGGSAGAVNVSVAKRTDGCISVRTGLGIWLPGLRADQVEIQVRTDGKWRPVAASPGGDSMVATALTVPDKSQLCKGKDTSVRYRVIFRHGAPGGQVSIVAEAHTARGALVGRAIDTAQVVGRTGAAPAPQVSLSPTPEPTEEPIDEEVEEEIDDPTSPPAAGAVESPADAASGTGGGFGIGTVVMLVGGAMVAMGAALLVVLLRRSRSGNDDPGGGNHPGGGAAPRPPFPGGPSGGGGDATLLLPRVPPTRSRY